jgi:hypothetical protein
LHDSNTIKKAIRYLIFFTNLFKRLKSRKRKEGLNREL